VDPQVTTSTNDELPTNEELPEFPFPRPAGDPLGQPQRFAELRDRASAVRVRTWDGCPYVVTRHAAAKVVFTDGEHFSADPSKPGFSERNSGFAQSVGLDRNFRNMDGAEHAAQRALVAEDFSRRRLNLLRPFVNATAERLVATAAADADTFDVVEKIAFPLSITVLCELLGVPVADRDYFQRRVNAAVSPIPEEAAAAGEDLTSYMGNLVVTKLQAFGDDVLSRLAAKVDEGVITHDEAVSIGRMLLIGGFETTANTLGLGVLTLLTHQVQRELFVQNMSDEKLLANAINEIIRYCPVQQTGQRRVAIADVRIGEAEVHAGNGIICANGATNFDERVFENPYQLDLRRPNANAHLGFGFGPHSCIAQSLARMELTACFTTLLRQLPDVRLVHDPAELPTKNAEDLAFVVRQLLVTW
jgi:cytochrome P450